MQLSTVGTVEVLYGIDLNSFEALDMIGVTGAPAPIKVADIIARLPHVGKLSPVVMQLSTVGTVEVR